MIEFPSAIEKDHRELDPELSGHRRTRVTMTTFGTNSKSTGMLLRVVGAALLFATGAIHLDLYLTGYQHIATIGILFLLQVISAFALGLSVLAIGQSIVSISGALFSLSTLVGYVLSLWFGLFGFNEVRTTAGIVAGAIEIATFLVLGAWTVWFAPTDSDKQPALFAMPAAMNKKTLPLLRQGLVPLVAIAIIGLVVVEASSSPPTGTNSSTQASASAPAPTGASVTVLIKNFAFVPVTVKVHAGETIVVKNEDGVAHTLTAMPGAATPGTFDSGSINPNKAATVTAPSKPGSYAFYCSIHPFMIGTLQVTS